MNKFQFLCINHRRWLSDRPEAAVNTWLQSYSRSQDLAEERSYLEAINHAGAAFEASEIVLGHKTVVTSIDIDRFADSGVLLARLLSTVGESKFAHAVIGSAIDLFERLLVAGCEQATVLAGCQRLLETGEYLRLSTADNRAYNYNENVSGQIH